MKASSGEKVTVEVVDPKKAHIKLKNVSDREIKSGEALAAVKGATLVDAVVMASAATRGDIVYTADVTDLERLRRHFPGVRVLSV